MNSDGCHYFQSFPFGVKGEFVIDFPIIFILKESHFRLSWSFSFSNLAICLCKLSPLRLFLCLEELPRFGNYRDTIKGETFPSALLDVQLSFLGLFAQLMLFSKHVIILLFSLLISKDGCFDIIHFSFFSLFSKKSIGF